MSDDLAKLIKAAAEAAKSAPEHLQEAAFNRAFDVLVNGVPSPQRHDGGASRTRTNLVTKPSGGRTDRAATLDQLDRTAYPSISYGDTALNNALRILQAAKSDLGIDGLTATEVAKILVDKFRCRITVRGVALALNDAGRLVNRHNEGQLVMFRIMGPGEDFLRDLESGKTPSEVRGGSTKRKGVSKRGSTRTATEPKDSKAPVRDTVRAKNGDGAVAGMSVLFEEGFFKSPRTIGDIVQKLKKDYGRTVKASELSPALLRWLRTKKVGRERNANGQYEYVER